MTPDYRVAFSSGGSIVSSNYEGTIAQEDVLFGLTFWDYAHYVAPTVPLIGLGVGADDVIIDLVNEGIVLLQGAPLSGWIDGITQVGPRTQCGPTATQAILDATCETLSDVISTTGPQWTLSRRSSFKPNPLYDKPSTSVEFCIQQAIPFVRQVESSGQFLEWRRANETNRRRLNSAISILTESIDEEKDPEQSLRLFKDDVDDYFSELSRKGLEKGLQMGLGSVILKVNVNDLRPWKFLGDAGMAAAFPYMFLPELAAGAIGLVAGIRPAVSLSLKTTPKLRGAHAHFPFEMVGRMFSQV